MNCCWLRISIGPTRPFVSAPLVLAIDRTRQLISDRDIEVVYVLVKDTDRSISFNNFWLDARSIKTTTKRSPPPCSTLVSLILPAARPHHRRSTLCLTIGSCIFDSKRRTTVPGKLIDGSSLIFWYMLFMLCPNFDYQFFFICSVIMKHLSHAAKRKRKSMKK